jgi:hypothetical protein
MVIVWGSRLMGRVDRVPGMFHVATRFGHLWYLPLIPLQSFVILAEHGDQFRGVPIPMSGKSILFAWARAALFVMTIISALVVLISANDKHMSTAGPAVFAALSATAFALVTWWKGCTHCSCDRAERLARAAGFTEAGLEQLRQAFAGRGQLTGGFEPVQRQVARPQAQQPQFDPRATTTPVRDTSSIPLE